MNVSIFHFIAFVLFITFISTIHAVKFSNQHAPFLLQGKNVRMPGEPFTAPYVSVAERRNALGSTQALMQKLNGENPYKNSGFIKVNDQYDSKMYYLFFESKAAATSKTPIILWLQGGPGCSSMTGAFAEVGPYLVNKNLEVKENPYSWNNEAHLLFIDNPVGAGFSSTKNSSGYARNEDDVAENLYKVLLAFLDLNPTLKSNPWIITGESYAGKYIPAIADKIRREGYQIPLTHIAIGDGLTHPITQFSAYDEFAYVNGLVPIYGVQNIKNLQNQTANAIQAGHWSEAMRYSNTIMSSISTTGGNLNVYDIRESHDYDLDHVGKYLSLPQIKELMHTVGENFEDCDFTSYQYLAEDIPQSVLPLVENLLNDDRVQVLFYNGMFDLIITATGTSRFLREAQWKHGSSYLSARRQTWRVKDESGKSVPAGWIRGYGKLTFLQIHNAGHLSPMDQPRNLLAMVNAFANNRLRE